MDAYTRPFSFRSWLRRFIGWNVFVWLVIACWGSSGTNESAGILLGAAYLTLYFGPLSYVAWRILRYAFLDGIFAAARSAYRAFWTREIELHEQRRS